jgi:hypothetical protein
MCQLTQGGARRLRRLVLPWANLFYPFGARRPSSAPGRRGPIVFTPRRGNYKIAQGRASRRSRDAPPWVARPPKIHRSEGARQDRKRDVITNNCETDVNGWPRFAGFDGQNECQRIGHVSCDSGIQIISTLGFSRLWRVCGAFVSPLQGDGRDGVAAYPGRYGAVPPLRFALESQGP